MEKPSIPPGFEQLPKGLGFIDAIQPVYRRVDANGISFGLIVSKTHANTMGVCHGGVLMTLADITAASGANFARGEESGSPTLNLSLDFIATGRMGDWLQGNVDRVSIKRRFGFCSGTIDNADGVVARFNGTFYFPDHDGMWKGQGERKGLFTFDND